MQEALQVQTEFWGAADIHAVEPPVTVHHDVVYWPSHPELVFDAHLDWGIYSSIGQRVDTAAPRRSPALNILGQSEWKLCPAYESARAPERSYIYGGVIVPQYGHFIITSLSRLWYLLERDDGRSKILFHSPRPMAALDSFVREFLNAAGVASNRIVIFDRPTWIERLIVPGLAVVEQSHAHSIARQVFLRIGDKLDPIRRGPPAGGRPLYLSKTKLPRGAGRILNESTLEETLAGLGVETVWPELLSTREKIALFRSGRSIITVAWSGAHTSAFARRGGKRLFLSFEALNTNQLILDRLTWPDAVHLRPAAFENRGRSERFETEYEIAEPEAVAEAMMVYV